jgi:hypothetical protein
MRTIISALSTFLFTFFRSRATLQLEILALRHHLTVFQRTTLRPRIDGSFPDNFLLMIPWLVPVGVKYP